MSRLTFSAALPEDPPTPLWELVLEQFKDQLVLILLGSATVSFVLALFEESDDWTPFVDPAVVCFSPVPIFEVIEIAVYINRVVLIDPYHPHSQCRRRCHPGKQRGKSYRGSAGILRKRSQGRERWIGHPGQGGGSRAW